MAAVSAFPLQNKLKVNERRELLLAIASQMEIGAEFSNAFVNLRNGFFCRIHEFDERSEFAAFVASGALDMIPNLPSQDLYLWMAEFAETLSPSPLQEELRSALRGVSAVWRFRNVLYRQDALSQEWESFKRAKLLKTAEDWIIASLRRPTA